MSVLDWIGKDKVVNHHLDVPYRVLERKYSFDENGQHEEDNGSENMIIHGDNLEALKSLLPEYEARVDCIYIDPPYNTGNEKWVYNDNVNDPQIKKWLGEVVGTEGDDLSRHDKWLCMMYPRLKLLHRLLSDNGAIFISIDDNEQANLKLICNEIFGVNKFVGQVSWQRTYSPRNDSKGISQEVEYLLVYKKTDSWIPRKLPRTEKMNSVYRNPDNDFTEWRTSDAFAPEAITHQGMVYAIQHPVTGEYIYPYVGGHWPYEQDRMLQEMQEWAKYKYEFIDDDNERARICGVSPEVVRKNVPAIVLDEPIEKARDGALDIIQNKVWPRFFFTSGGYGGIARKTYLDPENGRVLTNLWFHKEVGHTDSAKKQIKEIFSGDKVFDTPKPIELLQRIFYVMNNKNAIILDSFAGSATTAHAIIDLNKQDGGNRKFILIELMDYADAITAERVKRVISGYEGKGKQEDVLFSEKLTMTNLRKGEELVEEANQVREDYLGNYDKVSRPTVKDNCLQVIGTKVFKEYIPGLGGSFSYYELGEPLLIDGKLNESVGIDKIREYIYYTETRNNIPKQTSDEPELLGRYIDTAYYFCYQSDSVTTLNREWLQNIKTKAESYVIYADLCTLNERELQELNIVFKKIPRDITRL